MSRDERAQRIAVGAVVEELREVLHAAGIEAEVTTRGGVLDSPSSPWTSRWYKRRCSRRD